MAGCLLLLRGLVLALVLPQAELSAFLPASQANQVLSRWRRAGSYLLEELLQGNLERECYEEVCLYEEAREVFEDEARTDGFWRQYWGGSPCVSQPCLNNGSCQDHIRGYTCTCPPGYEGRNCAMAKGQCHLERTHGCQHFCHPGMESYVCSCAKGHRLGKDHKSCIPNERCACGTLASEFITAPEGSEQSPPSFPWQVQLTNSSGKAFCGGVLIREDFVLTTAKCSLLYRNISVKANSDPTEDPATIGIRSAHLHLWYDPESGHNDVSLLELERPVQCPHGGLPVCVPEKDFAERVLTPGTAGLLSGWTFNGTTALGTTPARLPVTQVDREECRQALNVTMTTRTCCERGRPVAGQWVEGSVVTREHQGTWFLTGILGSRPAARGPEFLLTAVSRYSLWFQQVMR